MTNTTAISYRWPPGSQPRIYPIIIIIIGEDEPFMVTETVFRVLLRGV